MVTVILADYRGFDTLGEEVVIFTAGIICFLLLRKRKISHEQD
jgi:multicomponent Na+:H+ antiporter subunit B